MTSPGVAQLLRTFGQNNLDAEVLESVLEMFNGNVNEATAFLRSTNRSDYIEDTSTPAQNQKTKLPKDYMDRPSDWKNPVEQASEELTTISSHPAYQMKSFLLREGTTFFEHLERQTDEYDYYAAVIILLLEKSVEISFACKSRALAAAWARKDYKLANIFLNKEDWFVLPEVLKALKILDAPRRRKALEKKIAKLQARGKVKPKVIFQLRSKINEIRSETPDTQTTSVNGALAERVKKWLYSIPDKKLAFYAIQMPKEPWQELADIIHPKSGNMQMGWFFEVMFGKEAPEDSVVKTVQNLTINNLENRFKQSPIPYSFLRRQITGEIPLSVKVGIAKYERINTLIWYHEELVCPEVDAIISDRLAGGEIPSFTYGKLMERLLYFKMNKIRFYDQLISLAEQRLHSIKLPLEPPVVVCGDASYSMDIAIRTATVIGSVLTVVSQADLRFFNVESTPPHILPRTIPQVMDVALNTRAIDLQPVVSFGSTTRRGKLFGSLLWSQTRLRMSHLSFQHFEKATPKKKARAHRRKRTTTTRGIRILRIKTIKK
eukprot:TRINITY_DN287_c0_g1_i1.p1 TRINITY_DN287_c0_g1~~TRINITY_DN287_c0_g1_i1.p1  ORF type:complete len:548 (+),score=92.80 TRINITY_DN287_c0_g1_i1:208-1851(+)